MQCSAILFWDRSHDCSDHTTSEDGVCRNSPAQMFQCTQFLFYLFGVKRVDGTDKRVLPNRFMVYLGMNSIEHGILAAHNNLITEKEVFVALKHSGCCIYPANKS